jgi:hypothetical protein
VTVNIAGPGQFTDGTDGSFTLVGTGNWLWGNHPKTGEPGLFLLSGRFVLSVDAQVASQIGWKSGTDVGSQ